jgi:hypothetical protein
MNLIFEKKEPQTVVVKINHEGNIQDFQYITMLKALLDHGSLGDSEISGDFSEAERSSIASMVKHLNACVPTKDCQLDSDGNETGENIASEMDL